MEIEQSRKGTEKVGKESKRKREQKGACIKTKTKMVKKIKMKNEKIEKELKGKIGQSRERKEEVEQDRNILQK